jgi:TIR domain/Tetratricopeptide repeat
VRSHYPYDVFLSHSSVDKPVVRALAERLQGVGLRVWFDEWIICPGDPISHLIAEGLEQSRVLLLFMSEAAFRSDWALLESHSSIFRDPLNRDRRFVPLRLDDTPINAMLRGYAYVDWRSQADRQASWRQLLKVWDLAPQAQCTAPILQAGCENTTSIQAPHNLPLPTWGGAGLIGREAALARLAALLEQTGEPVLITGMDGVGKTALALHHLRQRLHLDLGGVVMLDGQRGFDGLVQQLQLFMHAHFDQSLRDQLPPDAALAWVYSHWPLPQRVLLMVDELQQLSDLQALGQGLPQRFRIVATSRNRLGAEGQRLTLEPLDDEASVRLLQVLAERSAFDGIDRHEARFMAREVGGLPMALHLLGRQLARDRDLTVAELRQQLRRPGQLADGLAEGFRVAWQRLSADEQQLGRVFGALPAMAVPWELLALARPAGLDPYAWVEARLGLEQQHLIERPLARLYQMHPLLHRLLEQQADTSEGLKEALLQWLAGFSDVLEASHLERHQRCLPLLEALAQWPPERWPDATAGLPHLALGRLLLGLGDDGKAQLALQKALELVKGKTGEVAATLEAGCLVALAGVARERGEQARAEHLCRQALAVLGCEGCDALELERAEALNGLGLALHAVGNPEAETVLRQALQLRSYHLEDSHRLVQVSRCNLALALGRLGEVAEAETLYGQVLAVLDSDLCEVAVTARNNLAALAERAGQLDKAHALLAEAVELAGRALGDAHPRRGLMFMSLGILAERRGCPEEAETHYRTAAAMVTAAWGPDHPRSQDCRLTLDAFLATKE